MFSGGILQNILPQQTVLETHCVQCRSGTSNRQDPLLLEPDHSNDPANARSQLPELLHGSFRYIVAAICLRTGREDSAPGAPS